MSLGLCIVPITAACFCVPWHARGFEQEAVHGACCCYCGRDIAVPESLRGKHAACIYCGFERGELPEVEIEPFAESPIDAVIGEAE